VDPLPLITVCDPATDPDPFSSVVFKMTKKINFCLLFCCLLTEGSFTSVFKDRMLFRSNNKILFLHYFALRWKSSDPGGLKPYGSGTLPETPVDLQLEYTYIHLPSFHLKINYL
jgi:hypothetical protein